MPIGEALRNSPAAVYRHYDAANVLLYIGMSGTPERRDRALRQSVATRHWARFSHHRTDTWFANRGEAREQERAAVNAEWPLFNTNDHGRPRSDRWDLVTVTTGDGHIVTCERELFGEMSRYRWSCDRGMYSPPLSGFDSFRLLHRLCNPVDEFHRAHWVRHGNQAPLVTGQCASA